MAFDQKHGDAAISTLQVQVDDVKNVMSQNIEKVLDREERLSELADRSDDLQTAVILHSFTLCRIFIGKMALSGLFEDWHQDLRVVSY